MKELAGKGLGIVKGKGFEKIPIEILCKFFRIYKL